ncbi:PAS domain-containing methyl-accepting chemotaxis protein [Thalassospira sp.]|uniref:methyl-accepting chemotaxis protein n=1 Tax=Thalassospira sp. TaxID=1912094 RepID=UPI002733449C|nr:PAS domain-containing methyl-accepting chemotaxis protein [Thalassospira sp.]MDP2698646.1 PAS domain-containing methyl-accepting chemotaxis protein [Thalassospira sp.]
MKALDLSMGIIRFTLDGTILSANGNFCSLMGYSADEIVGKHHSMFVEPNYRDSLEYAAFWEKLNRGNYVAAQFKRLAKSGGAVWIEASYNPVFDRKGRIVEVIKFASDITASRMRQAELEGISDAISKSQAVIEFEMDGTILKANENFLSVMGYRADEIVGKHHSMFVEEGYGNSPEYRNFWKELNAGKFQAAQFKRIGKNGKIVWIEASYNPILDPNGKPVKVTKFATDITDQINLLVELKSMIDNNFTEIDASIEQLGGSAGLAFSASSETAVNVQTVAAGAEQLSASIAEISRNMSQSRTATEQMFDQAVSADSSTQRMAEVVSAMGGIVEVIRNIAGQINLLALNATIESARAGEAGKGFAVVANEVKNLANQSARATEQIALEINGIQNITTEVVASLKSIRNSVETVRDNVTMISAAVEEQSAVTEDVSGNMQNMSEAVDGFSRNIENIKLTAELVAGAVFRTREAAQILAR